MTTEASARVYRVRSSEGHVFAVDEAVVMQSEFLSSRVKYLDCSPGTIISVPMVDTKILEKVLDWCKQHTLANKVALHPDLLRKWEDEYVVDGIPRRLLEAASCLKIPELVDWLINRKGHLMKEEEFTTR